MKILVTGGLGFIGSNFISHALEKYPEINIINIDAQLAGSNLQNLTHIEKLQSYRYVKANINDKKIMDKLISVCDVVINFAAESHVDRSISDPKPFIDSNILGAYTILESIRKYKKKLIHISTDEVFGSLESGSANERFPLNPSSPYASSKASAELLSLSYITTYGCDIIITRCTNNYGPRQSPEKLIPKTIILSYKNKKIPIYGSGKNIRDWIYVLDHCEAIMKILFEGKSGEFYNIAGNNELDNLTIVKQVLKIMGKSSDLIEFTDDRPGHDFRYSIDASKMYKNLRWKPKHNFNKGLENTISWYLDNKAWWKKIPSKILAAPDWKAR